MKQRILVTGGAGFLGAHLCRRLLDEGNEVLCLDNFCTGSRDNIIDLMPDPFFEIVRHDVCVPVYLEVDKIYHLACPASPAHYQRDPIQTIKTNVLGALNVLGLAKRLQIPVLLASTSEIYGDPLVHPQPETYRGNVNPVGIRSCYDEGKRCAETLFFDYHRRHGLDIRVARIFNTYGPGMAINDGRAVSNFVVRALSDEDVIVYGDGSQSRSLCYVDDMIEGCIGLMNKDDIHEPVNLGNPVEFSVLELAGRIIKAVNSHSNLRYAPLPDDDPKQRCPDIGRAKSLLGWEPRIDFADGILRTIDFFKQKPADKPVR